MPRRAIELTEEEIEFLKEIRSTFRDWLDDQDMKQGSVADKMGVTPSAVSAQLRNGNMTLLSLARLAKAANAKPMIWFAPRENEGDEHAEER